MAEDADGNWTLLDRFDGNAKIVGDDLVYQLGNYLLARNWRSSDVRKLVYFNPSSQQSEVLVPSDPALLRSLSADYNGAAKSQ